MSQYYLHYYRILGLNGVGLLADHGKMQIVPEHGFGLEHLSLWPRL